MSYYSTRAGPILKRLLEARALESPEERLSLVEEADIAREVVLDAVKLFEAACIVDPEKTPEHLRIAAGQHVKSALQFVSDVVLKAARARLALQGTTSPEDIAFVVKQVALIIHRHVEDPRALAAIDTEIEGITLPSHDPADIARRLRNAVASMELSVP